MQQLTRFTADDWHPVRTADGSWTFAHPAHRETCHSRAGAWQQARERYAKACRLQARARELEAHSKPEEPLVLRLLDVGTGMGFNLAAALEALAGTRVRLQAISLENEPSVVRATLAWCASAAWQVRSHELPPGLEQVHIHVRRAFAAALADPRAAESPCGVALDRGSLRWLVGDARTTLASLPSAPCFDAVFLDPFSPRVDPDLWEPAFLDSIARRMRPGSILSTYTTAMSVRAGLCAAGLRVGAGPRVGTKAAGTLASPDIDPETLGPRTRRKLERRAEELRKGREQVATPGRGPGLNSD